MKIRYILTILTTLCLCLTLSAQVDRVLSDSVIIKQDSVIYESMDSTVKTTVQDSAKYKAIQELSHRSKFTEFVYRFIFRPVIRESVSVADANSREHFNAQGKIIRNIEINTIDPFGNTKDDSTRSLQLMLMKTGNGLHVKTRAAVIRNLLLVRENQRYDSAKIRESIRLIRIQKYIRDVTLNVKKVSRDSIDILITAMDVWSIIPSVRRSSTQTGVALTDLNFAGLGSTFHISSDWIKPSNKNVTHLKYLAPNIRNSYINLNIQYLFAWNNDVTVIRHYNKYFYSPVGYNPQNLISENDNVVRSIELTRPFYSPVAQWAGGIFLGTIMTYESTSESDSLLYLSAPINLQDYWFARSWQMNETNRSGERITSFVLSGRYVKTKSPRRPQEIIDADLFNSHSYIFGSMDITSRKFVQDKYLFNYGKTEYVPEGRIFGATIGLEAHERSRLYVGFNAGWGSYYGFGYLGTHLEYGTFKVKSGLQQGVLTGRINYFTRLFSAGSWKIRQFVRPSFIFGINRLPADNLIQNLGIKGFNPLVSDATYLAELSLQTQSYAPWKLAGFNFGPYLFTHIGVLGNESTGLKNNRLYSLLGLGLLIKNDYLMFSTFQVSLSFYPFIPERGYNIFRMNAYETGDYGLRDFEALKPGLVEFR